MADAIQSAIDAAKRAAEASGQVATGGVPAASNANTAVAPVTRAAPLSASDMMSGSFSVDAFLKVTEDGIKIGEKSNLITDPFSVVINLADAFYYFAIKYGNPATYEKTQDQVRSLTGKPWADLLATAAKVDGDKFKGSYRSGDIPMRLLEDVKDFKGTVVEASGTTVGKSLSTTEWKEYEAFLRSVGKQGLNPDHSEVEVRIGFKQKKNNNGNVWGILTFSLLGEHLESEAA